jgi:hypothetical protein
LAPREWKWKSPTRCTKSCPPLKLPMSHLEKGNSFSGSQISKLTNSFKIHTRTCLTRTVENGTPSTRMYCTTQCDWSASSMLKSTITPAVIKGQKEYHQSWLSALKEWIDAHPEDFKSTGNNSTDSSEKPKSTPNQTANGAKVVPLDSKSDVIPERSTAPIDTHVVAPASAIHESTDITKNQPMMAILLVCLLSIALNVYLVSK